MRQNGLFFYIYSGKQKYPEKAQEGDKNMKISKEMKKLFAGRWGKLRLQELENSGIQNLDVYEPWVIKMFVESRDSWEQFRRRQREERPKEVETEYEARYCSYDDPSYGYIDFAIGERFDDDYEDIEDSYYD